MTAHEEKKAKIIEKSALKSALFVLTIVGIVFAFAMGAMLLRSKKDQPLSTPLSSTPVETAVIRQVKHLTIPEFYSGLISASRSSKLGFSSLGTVEQIYVDVGDVVEVGETLARLDTRTLNFQLETETARIRKLEADLELAKTTLDRHRRLYQLGHVSQQLVEEHESKVTVAKAEVAAGLAEANTIRSRIKLFDLQAPFSGTISARYLDEGAIASPSEPILELVETSFLEAQIGLSEHASKELSVGTEYELVSDSGSHTALLKSTTAMIDAQDRTILAVFQIEDSSEITVGKVVRIRIDRKVEESGFWVPVDAMTSDSRGLWTIYELVLSGDKWTVEASPVEIIHSEGANVYVRGAIEEGATIITSGLHRIVPGQSVAPHLPKGP